MTPYVKCVPVFAGSILLSAYQRRTDAWLSGSEHICKAITVKLAWFVSPGAPGAPEPFLRGPRWKLPWAVFIVPTNGQKALQRPLMECLLVWRHCSVAAWNKAVGDEGARANSWLFKLCIISIPGFSPPPGSLSLLTITSIRGKEEETRGDEIQMNPLCYLLAAQLPNTQGEAAAALLWVSILHAILVPPAACNIEWAAWKWSVGWKKKGGGSFLQQ